MILGWMGTHDRFHVNYGVWIDGSQNAFLRIESIGGLYRRKPILIPYHIDHPQPNAINVMKLPMAIRQ